VRRALASQRECLKLLDAKIGYYADCLSALHEAPVHEAAPREAVPQATAS
jgi:hypothetical protein